MSARIALATCSEFSQLAEDDPGLLDELRRRGVDAMPTVWDDADMDWDSFDLVVIRSTWDYAPRREEFVQWALRVPRLLNSAEVVAWNTDKRYLAELPHTVDTQFLAPGDQFEPRGSEYVIKPAISAGSRDTARYGPGEEEAAARHAAALLAAGRVVIVQPYLASVDEHGETALLFFAGRYSHAVRKGQMLRRGSAPAAGIYVEEEISPREADQAEREIADEVLDSLRWSRAELLYARVDLIRGPDGSPRLVELELTEPSLFLSYGKGAAGRLADEIVSRL